MLGKSLIIGASGQIGVELVEHLQERLGIDNVVASDIRPLPQDTRLTGKFEILNVLDDKSLEEVIQKHQIKDVYLLAALLSATAEEKPMFAWDLNMTGLFNLLELAKKGKIQKIFWPSSIAVFGPSTPKVNTPQNALCEPNTVYGISKLAGERWCEYYFNKYGVDVRSIRYPGLIGYKSLPGGGTTDYAVDIFHKALESGTYESFLSEDSRLPMMYMEDAIKATVGIMDAPEKSIKVRSSYNISGMDFTPRELAEAIKKEIPEFTMTYKQDSRQTIADSWPQSIDDSVAFNDWGWKSNLEISQLVEIMLSGIAKKKAEFETL